MKKSLILIAAALAVMLSSVPMACPAGAQELTVTYKMSFNPESPELLSQAKGNSMAEKMMKEIYSKLVLTWRLVYKDGVSEWRVIPTGESQPVKIMGVQVDMAQYSSAYEKSYTYKDHNEGVILERIQVPGQNLLVTGSLNSEQFMMVEDGETREILGHICHQAVSESGETIWLTTDFDIRNEPEDCGLDGLALLIEDETSSCIAVSIEESAASTPERPEAKKTMTREEYKAKYEK